MYSISLAFDTAVTTVASTASSSSSTPVCVGSTNGLDENKMVLSIITYTPLLTWHDAGDVGDNDGLPEDGPVEDVADRSVGGLPHTLQLELCMSTNHNQPPPGQNEKSFG